MSHIRLSANADVASPAFVDKDDDGASSIRPVMTNRLRPRPDGSAPIRSGSGTSLL